MKNYLIPTTAIVALEPGKAVCQTLFTSFGSNEDLKYGGQAGPGFKPM